MENADKLFDGSDAHLLTYKDKMHEAVYSYMQTDACKYAVLNCNYSLLIIAGWQAAKESSRKELEAKDRLIALLRLDRVKEAKELEAAKQTIAEYKELVHQWGNGRFDYPELIAEKEALEKKLAEQQAVIAHVYVVLNSCEESDNPNHGVSEVIRKIGKTDPVEMDKLLAAARQQGFEEGVGSSRIEELNIAYNKGKQVGRDELQKERDKLFCTSIMHTQNDVGGRLVCDVAELLNYFNENRPDRPLPPQVKGD